MHAYSLFSFPYFRERRLMPGWTSELHYLKHYILDFVTYVYTILLVFHMTPFMISLAPRPWHPLVHLLYWANTSMLLLKATQMTGNRHLGNFFCTLDELCVRYIAPIYRVLSSRVIVNA